MDKSDETVLALVEAVRKRPITYSGVVGFNSYRAEHTQAWIDVAAEMGVTVAACKERWQTLRRGHTRFLSKGVEMQIPAIHERLRFLDDKINARQEQIARKKSLLSSSKFNLKLLKLVQQHPWLYDDTPRCSAKNRESWETIASMLNDKVTADVIKGHWHWLRRSYHQFAQTSKRGRPERIESHMHFLKPYLKISSSGNSLPKPAKDLYFPILPKIVGVESHAHLGYDPGDPDAAFLLSILPHLKVMTGQQRRQFKRQAVMLSADVLSDL